MTSNQYQFSNAWEMADVRLDWLELAHDSATKRRAVENGVKAGAHCLEVGAGRGSIIRWLSDVVGPPGRVAAVDIDPRFLQNLASGNVEVQQLDIVTAELP